MSNFYNIEQTNNNYIYKENIERIKLFYNSTFFKKLENKYPKYIRSICESLMEDPDACDKNLYINKTNQLKNLNLICKQTSCIDNNIILGMDCVIGWKKLFNIYGGNYQWIEDYKLIRSSLNAHFLWPRNGNNTINTVRHRIFNDRIDFTLYEIKLFYENNFDSNNLKMKSAFDNIITKEWLKKFNTFKNLCDMMQLTIFVDNNYDVIDLSDLNKTIQNYNSNIRLINKNYLENLKYILQNI